MKTITIRQPHIELILSGHKRHETRSWRTNHRGPIAIHAGAAVDREALEAFSALVPAELLLGHVMGIVEVIDCIPAEVVTDRRFGDFSAGRWAWVLANPRRLERPIPARGRLGFWQIDL